LNTWLCARAKSPGFHVLDIGVIDQFVYNALPGSGMVTAWRMNRDGSLTDIGEFSINI
jgi:hypothetical protein